MMSYICLRYLNKLVIEISSTILILQMFGIYNVHFNFIELLVHQTIRNCYKKDTQKNNILPLVTMNLLFGLYSIIVHIVSNKYWNYIG